jgi:hypothetical protein
VIDLREGNNNPRNADLMRYGDGKDNFYHAEGMDAVAGCERRNPASP